MADDIDHLLHTIEEVMADRQQAWRAHAACTGATDLFFPNRGDSRSATQARTICNTCPVNTPCNQYATTLTTHTPGVWAGQSMRTRRGRKPHATT